MAGYIRQDTTNNIADGNVINASDFDNEYNAIEAAFNASTGHTHDGTSAEGAPITKIGPTQDVVASASALTPKTDNTVDLGSATLEYKDLYIDGTANIDSLVADTADINAGTIDGVTIGGASAGAGTFTTLSASSSVTLSGGTANGVLYLNGSKVATSGSALVFDGNNLGVGINSPGATLHTYGNAPILERTTTAVTSVRNTLNLRANTTGSATDGFGPFIEFSLTDLETTAGVLGGIAAVRAGADNTGNLLFFTSTTGTNTEQMRLTSTGLGIGTSSPNAKLEVNGNAILGAEVYRSVDTSYLRLAGGNPAATGANVIVFGSTHATAPGRVSINAVGTGHTEFSTGGAERMRLDSSGNLGLGVTPSAWGNGVSLQGSAWALSTTAGTDSGAFTVNARQTAYGSGSQNYVYRSTAPASNYEQSAGQHRWFTAPSGTAGNAISFTQAMTLNDSGNLGLGVTPSAWSTASSRKAIQLGYTGGAAVFTNAAGNTLSSFVHNAYDNGTNWLYAASSIGAARYEMTGANAGSTHAWYVSAGGTAGNAISFTQAMTLDASGNLGVGTTSAGCRFNATQAASAALGAQIALHNNASTAVGNAVEIALLTDSGASPSGIRNGRIRVVNENAGNGAANMQFWTWSGTTDAERARITSGGYFKASNGGTYVGSTSPYHELRKTENNADWAVLISHAGATAANQFGTRVDLAGDPNGLSNEFLYCSGGATLRASIRSNGGLANFSGNNVNLSDRREKTNFAPAKSYLDTICAIPVQTFEYIDQSPDDPGLTLGVVAQDVQAVAPELVMESNWGTEDNPKMRLSIYQTDLQYALMKCIQEQQELIKDLRARVAALEAQP